MEKQLINEIDRIKSMMGLISEGPTPKAVLDLFLKLLTGSAEKNAVKEFLEKGIHALTASNEKELTRLMSKEEGEAFIHNAETEIEKMADGADKKLAETHLEELKTFKEDVKTEVETTNTDLNTLRTKFNELKKIETIDIARSSKYRKILKDVKILLSKLKGNQSKFLEQRLQNEVTALETKIQMKSPKLMDYIKGYYKSFGEMSFLSKAVVIILALGTGVGMSLAKGVLPFFKDGIKNIMKLLHMSSGSDDSEEEHSGGLTI